MIIRYEPRHEKLWNLIVQDSLNGTFLFNRDYMDYHKDRFQDHSMIVYSPGMGRPLAIFPANQREKAIESHGGLTYGGIICGRPIGQAEMNRVLAEILTYYSEQGMGILIYKPVPIIYHKRPAEEDLFSLHRQGAQLFRRDALTVIDYHHPPSYTSARIWGLKKSPVIVVESDKWDEFWKILEEDLMIRHGRKPVHTVDEIKMLSRSFPQIRLYMALHEERAVGGCVIYETDTVAHAQYSAQTELGRELHAVEKTYDSVIQHYKNKMRYFDFGISTEWDGGHSILNEGLIKFKEEYGGTTAICDFYAIDLKGVRL